MLNSTQSTSTKRPGGNSKADLSNAGRLNIEYIISGADKTAEPLEKSIANLKRSTNLIIAKYWWEIQGIKSTARISAGKAVKFWINTGGPASPDYVLFKAVKRPYGKHNI